MQNIIEHTTWYNRRKSLTNLWIGAAWFLKTVGRAVPGINHSEYSQAVEIPTHVGLDAQIVRIAGRK